MVVFRTGNRKHIDKLDGKGGQIVQGRWHTRGHEIVYTSSSLALSLLEVFKLHSIEILPEGTCGIEIEIPEDSMEVFNHSDLPDDWNDTKRYNKNLQQFGDRWLMEQRSLVLKVPSAITSCDSNYLINPNHPNRTGIKILQVYELKAHEGYLRLDKVIFKK